MEFRDLKRQYHKLKPQIDEAISEILECSNFISGNQVKELEARLAEYVGVKHCISCANGTDALSIALMAWQIGPGDAVFVPDFTFFSTAEVVASCGATPVFVDVNSDTFNIDCIKLKRELDRVLDEGKLIPKVIIPVDLFGQPADYSAIRKIASQYNMKILEDGAQGFGGMIGAQRSCSFGDISTTSFFPAKPLGCYGDGGAIFTDSDEWALLMRSICIHGKGSFKYDNVRIGVNSRLDTIQAAVLNVKLDAFISKELKSINEAANYYSQNFSQYVKIPVVLEGFYSSWAQYVIQLPDEEKRNNLQQILKGKGIPSMVYYPKTLHCQEAFRNISVNPQMLNNAEKLTKTVLALPIYPYMTKEEQDSVIHCIQENIAR